MQRIFGNYEDCRAAGLSEAASAGTATMAWIGKATTGVSVPDDPRVAQPEIPGRVSTGGSVNRFKSDQKDQEQKLREGLDDIYNDGP